MNKSHFFSACEETNGGIEDCGFWIANCRLWIVDGGLRGEAAGGKPDGILCTFFRNGKKRMIALLILNWRLRIGDWRGMAFVPRNEKERMGAGQGEIADCELLIVFSWQTNIRTIVLVCQGQARQQTSEFPRSGRTPKSWRECCAKPGGLIVQPAGRILQTRGRNSRFVHPGQYP
jgi:hypothetical protein